MASSNHVEINRYTSTSFDNQFGEGKFVDQVLSKIVPGKGVFQYWLLECVISRLD